MEKFIRDYGVIFLLYLVMVFGVLGLNERMSKISSLNSESLLAQKTFTK